MTVQLTSLQLLMHILQNAASIGVVAATNAASRNRLSITDRQQNYLDHMSTAAQQQQQDRNRVQHVEACARLTDQERQQERRHHRKQQAETYARLTDQERQQQHDRDRDREQHRQARGQQDLHTIACVPLSEFDEAIVSVLDIGGRTTECQQCRAMIRFNEASRGHANLCCAKGRSCSCEALFPIPPPQPLRDLLTSEPAPGAHLPRATVSFRKHIRKYNSSL